jgi:hypothetical protein
MRQHGTVALLPMILAAVSCGRPGPSASYDLLIRVGAGGGRAVAGARVLFQGKQVGTSKDNGMVKLSIEGTEGEVFPFTIVCPDGYRSPAKPIDVTVRRLANPSEPPEFSVSCTPLTRAVVVAVRADQGPHLPIVYLGQEVARTDASGAAHVLLTLPPGEEFELMLDTANPAGERLRPQKPTGKFSVKNTDEMLTFHVPFTVEVEKRVAPRAAPRAAGPIRL